MHDASVYGSSHCLDLVDLEGLILLVSYISSDSYTFLSPLIQDSLSPGGGGDLIETSSLGLSVSRFLTLRRAWRKVYVF